MMLQIYPDQRTCLGAGSGFYAAFMASPNTRSNMVFDMDFCTIMLKICVLSRAQNFLYNHFGILFNEFKFDLYQIMQLNVEMANSTLTMF